MNLHGLVSGAIGSINPPVDATVIPAAPGYITAPDGSRRPNLGAPVQTSVQLQCLTTKDLYAIGAMPDLNGLLMQNQSRKVFLNGDWNGVIRSTGKGGDKIIINGQTWLFVQIVEQWPDWTSAIICLQNGS